MSDFGTLLLISKLDAVLSDEEKKEISHQLQSIINSGDYSESIKDGKTKAFFESGEHALAIKLTEYFSGDDEDKLRELAEEEDTDEVTEIADILQAKLGSDYQVKFSFEDFVKGNKVISFPESETAK